MANERRTVSENSIYTLSHVQVSSGNHEIPTATIILKKEDEELLETATGTGPVDAVYAAINKIIDVPLILTSYNVGAVTEGIDAQGSVTIRIKKDNREYVGRGSDTDILVASAKAYLHSINRLLMIKEGEKTPATKS